MSAMQRTKGAEYERKVAKLLTEATGTAWRRRMRNQAGDSDVVADESAFALIVIECKHANVPCLPACRCCSFAVLAFGLSGADRAALNE